MSESDYTLSDAIKKHITGRIKLCAVILFALLFLTVGFYVYFFTVQTVSQMDEISKDLTPYIISQEIIENRYAIDLKLDQISTLKHVKIEWIRHPIDHSPGFLFSGLLNWKYYVPVIAVDNKNYGYYVISGSLIKDKWMLAGLSVQFLFVSIFIFLICYVLYPIATSLPKKIIIGPINDLINLFQKSNKNEIDSFFAPYEIIFLRDRFREVLSQQNESLKKKEMLRIASQVAHDIRSPLAAINVAIHDVESIPEDRRVIIKSASRRINDIANNLLLSSRGSAVESDNNSEMTIGPELVFVALNNIVSEKKYEHYQFQSRINLVASEGSCNFFSNIDVVSFKRVISNLINNSIESLGEDGFVTVRLECNISNIEILIEDNGRGIPDEVLPKITEHGFSFGKKTGAGFGLSYAKQCIEKFGGKLFISSELNVGTKVKIDLLPSSQPFWFCDSLSVNRKSVFVILDDDPSIHSAWGVRFNGIPDVKLIHFTKASDLDPNEFCKLSTCYLIDYELIGGEKNGLDVIGAIGSEGRSFLVSSNFEDADIRSRCEKMAVKIIPKENVPYIPIVFLH